MAYTITILPRAQRALAALHGTPAYGRIVAAIRALAETPRPPGCLKLTGQPAWRIRVGDHRIIYEIDDGALRITVIDIGHRRDVYR